MRETHPCKEYEESRVNSSAVSLLRNVVLSAVENPRTKSIFMEPHLNIKIYVPEYAGS
jgi:hypothetical protein